MDSKFEYADSPLIYMYGPENEKYHPNGELLKSYVAKESIVDVDNMNSVIEKNIFYVKR